MPVSNLPIFSPNASQAAPKGAGANGAGKTSQAGQNSNARNADAADKDDDKQSFSNVLHGKVAGNDGAQKDARTDATAKKDDDATTDTKADATDATTQPPVNPDALLAALLPPQLRQTLTAAATSGTAAEAAAGALGKDMLKNAADPRTLVADAKDAGMDRAAGITEGASDKLAALGLSPADGKDGSAGGTGGTDFSALLGRLRGNSGNGDTASAATAEPSTSTLAMLMPTNQTTDTQATQAAQATRPTTLIEAPVGSPMFADEAASRVTWMAKAGIQNAEIRVTPPDMGPIQVSIEMKQNEATINFTVQQTDTRVALEDSLHRLEEQLANAGIALSQANVSQQDLSQGGGSAFQNNGSGRPSGSGRGDGNRGNGGGGEGDGADGISGAITTRPTSSGRGLVDTFA